MGSGIVAYRFISTRNFSRRSSPRFRGLGASPSRYRAFHLRRGCSLSSRPPTILDLISQPAKRVRGDIGKAPARVRAVVGFAQLDDVRSVRPANLSTVELPEWVAPEDVPTVDPWVVDAERRAVEEVRQDQDILDRTALQNPGEADFPPPLMSFAIGRVHDGIH